MTLETLALVSQVVGVAAVFASLIFVSIQIREQVNATRPQTEQAIASNWLGSLRCLAPTPKERRPRQHEPDICQSQ
jgi:hypothetical protein